MIACDFFWSWQVLANGPLLDGRNVVLAAETGSGKTLAYLGPIISQLVEGMQQGRCLPIFRFLSIDYCDAFLRHSHCKIRKLMGLFPSARFSALVINSFLGCLQYLLLSRSVNLLLAYENRQIIRHSIKRTAKLCLHSSEHAIRPGQILWHSPGASSVPAWDPSPFAWRGSTRASSC